MSYFLSEQYQKPRLVENRTIKNIIESQPIQQPIIHDTFFDDILKEIIETIKINYKIIFFILVICIGLYWRYREIQQIKNNKLDYETDSDSDSDEEIY